MARSTNSLTINLTKVGANIGDIVVKNHIGVTVFTLYNGFNLSSDYDGNASVDSPDLTNIISDLQSLLPSGWLLDTTGSSVDGGAETLTLVLVFTVSAAIGESYGGYHIDFENISIEPIITGDNIFTYGMRIKDTPQQYEPVHNDLPFVVSGTNNTQSNYKYWCDVYFNGSTQYDYRLYTFPRPDGFGFFNLKTIIRDYVSGDLDINTTEDFYRCTNMYKPYNVYFGESYGSTGTVSSGLVSSGTYYAFDGSLEWSEFISYSQNDRLIRTSGTGYFLTNYPQGSAVDYSSTVKIGDSEYGWLYMAVKESTAAYWLKISTYDSSQSLLGTYTYFNNYNEITDDSNRFLRVPCGTANIPLLSGANLNTLFGSLPIITSNVKYYTLSILNSSLATVSKVITFEVNSNCSKYDAYRLHYKNKWGGFDSFTFTAINRESGDIERKSYKKQYGSISTSGNWSYTKKDRGITNYSTKSKRKLRLTSDWVTESQYELLIELIESPQVYWDDSGSLFAVNILNTSYDVKTTDINKLINLELEVEFTQMNRRQ